MRKDLEEQKREQEEREKAMKREKGEISYQSWLEASVTKMQEEREITLVKRKEQQEKQEQAQRTKELKSPIRSG